MNREVRNMKWWTYKTMKWTRDSNKWSRVLPDISASPDADK